MEPNQVGIRRWGTLAQEAAIFIAASLLPLTVAQAQAVGPVMPEPPRQEIEGQIAVLNPLGLVLITPTGPRSVLLGGMQANPQIGGGLLGGFRGIDQLFQPLGAGGAPLAPVPTEWQIRVTTTLEVISPNDVIRFRAELDPRSGQPIERLKVIELYPQGVGAEPQPEVAAGEIPWTDVFVERRNNREIMVRSGPRRYRLPVTAECVVRFVSSDPRWLSVGDQAHVVARQGPNGPQATRVRAHHVDAALEPEKLPSDDTTLVAIGFGEWSPAPLGIAEPVGAAAGAGPMAGAGALEQPIRPGGLARRAAQGDEPFGSDPAVMPMGTAGPESPQPVLSKPASATIPVSDSPLGDGGRAFGRRVRIN